MSLSMIIILPIFAGFGLLYWSSLLDDDHAILGLLFQLLYVPLIWLSIHFAIIDATIVYSSNSDLVSQLGLFAEILGYVALIIGAYMSYVVFMQVKDWFVQKKVKREAERHGEG